MPIAACIPILQPAIGAAFSMDAAANAQATAGQITAALSSSLPMGLFPPAPTPIPMIPAGAALCLNNLISAFSMGPGATADASAQMIAMAISLIDPMVPPAGLSLLQSQIKSAFSLGPGANSQAAAAIIASAIPTYFMTGGAI